MKQGTKQRIVGSVVLLSLALIFLPIVFDGDGSYQPPVTSRIPDAPMLPEMVTPEPTRPQIMADTDAILLEDEESVVTRNANDGAEPAPAEDVESAEEEQPVDTAAAVTESEPDYVRGVSQGEPSQGEVSPLDATGLPRGWSVRLGSFSDRDNASSLVLRLQEAGYKAYSRVRDSSEGRLTVVYVGPWLDRTQADDYLARLREEFQLAGMVERYEIEQL